MTDRIEDCSICQIAVMRVRKKNFGGAFAVASRLNAKFDCSMARKKFSLLATAHYSETVLFVFRTHYHNSVIIEPTDSV